jgi:drug/metabolite transporter (DMT)-like permease
MATPDQSVKSLLAELVNNVSRLVRQELQLVQVETSEKTSQALEGVFVIIGGLLLAFAALLILLQAVVVGLSEFVEPWLASLIVGVVVAAIAFVLIKYGQNSLKAENLTPDRTLRVMRDQKDMVMERGR